MDLNRVVTFLRVVEAGSFTAAAKALDLPTSSVSRSIAKLERELGIVLLERTTRSVALTDAGRTYYERARDAVTGLDEAVLLAGEAASEPSGFVRVAAPPEMTGKLTATLGAFVRRYPKIQVDVVTTARGAELVGAGVDLAIVLGRLEDSSLMVRKLGTTVYRLYASATYLEQHGQPRTIADLAHHDAVLHRGNQGRAIWELTGPSGTESVEVHGALSGDSFPFVMQGIAGGHGIGLLPEQCLMAPDRGPEKLVPVLPEVGVQGAVQSLVYASQHLPKRVKLLRDHLAAEVQMQCTNAQHAATDVTVLNLATS